ASSGIGEAVAREFSTRGAHLVLLARRKERIDQLAVELSAQHKSIAIVSDVTRDGDLERAVRTALAEFGRIDIVVGNAGFGVLGPVSKLKLEDYRRQFETNVFGVLRTVHASLATLTASRGCLVLVGSVMSYLTTPSASAYGMSKHAVRALAEALDYECRGVGVKVKLVAPGFVRSEIHRVNNQGEFIPNAEDSVPDWLRVSAAEAARQIIDGLAGSRREIVITAHGKVIVWLNRLFPWFVSFVLGKMSRHRAEAAQP
ncbi:MAG: SDR family NAD(P)-dependent oxidoreductase, partial [Bdellovibrionales bacterium]|nr:SDR family NAD(P)-dependent oxidoreductase [Bdellovibrionales bacterium]